MQRIEAAGSERIRPLTAELERIHLNLVAILEGTCSGQVYTDGGTPPRTAYITWGVLNYLAGDPGNPAFNQALNRVLPRDQYFVLICDQDAWAGALDEILDGTYAVRATSRYLELRKDLLPDWQARIPEGYEMRPVDATLLSAGLKNLEPIKEWINEAWGSDMAFLTRGLGTCLVVENIIASWSLLDYSSGIRCEMGINTDPQHRRRGLGTLAAAATAARARDRGYGRVGWHCWANNVGSLGVARNVGFELVTDYDVFINHWPALNVTDMTQEEFRAFALGYERAFEVRPPTNGYPHIVAAKAWLLGRDRAGCFRHLNRAVDLEWLKSTEHLSSSGIRIWMRCRNGGTSKPGLRLNSGRAGLASRPGPTWVYTHLVAFTGS
jgi:RimJ/RimL family protein N-acetyltransferase